MCPYLQIGDVIVIFSNLVASMITHIISCIEVIISPLNHSHLKLQLKCLNQFFRSSNEDDFFY